MFLGNDDFREIDRSEQDVCLQLGEFVAKCILICDNFRDDIPKSAYVIIRMLKNGDEIWVIPRFRGLLKVHKVPLTLRPVLSCWGSQVGLISGILHILLLQLVGLVPDLVSLPDLVGRVLDTKIADFDARRGGVFWFIAWDFSSIHQATAV